MFLIESLNFNKNALKRDKKKNMTKRQPREPHKFDFAAHITIRLSPVSCMSVEQFRYCIFI